MNDDADIPSEMDKPEQKLADSRRDTLSDVWRRFSWKKDNKVAKLMEKFDAMQLQNTQLTRELKDVNREFDRYKTEAESAQMKSEILLKSKEIEKLKIFEQLTSRISQLENELLVKIEENLKVSGEVRSGIERMDKTLSTMVDTTSEKTLRATFDVSNLTDERIYSESSELAGMTWRTFLYKKDDHLAIHLEGQKTNKGNSCTAFVEFQLVSQKSEDIIYRRKAKKVDVYNGENGWGFEKFISFKDLFDGEKGYVMNDTILVAAVIKAFPSN